MSLNPLFEMSIKFLIMFTFCMLFTLDIELLDEVHIGRHLLQTSGTRPGTRPSQGGNPDEIIKVPKDNKCNHNSYVPG